MRGLMVAVVMLWAGGATAQDRQSQFDASALLELHRIANDHCRGGPGDRPETTVACEVRDDLGRRLGAVGWCYGRPGEYGYQMNWHRCDERRARAQPRR